MDLKPYHVTAVEWEDAHYNTEELDVEEVRHKPWIYVTVGVLIKSDETGVTVSTLALTFN